MKYFRLPVLVIALILFYFRMEAPCFAKGRVRPYFDFPLQSYAVIDISGSNGDNGYVDRIILDDLNQAAFGRWSYQGPLLPEYTTFTWNPTAGLKLIQHLPTSSVFINASGTTSYWASPNQITSDGVIWGTLYTNFQSNDSTVPSWYTNNVFNTINGSLPGTEHLPPSPPYGDISSTTNNPPYGYPWVAKESSSLMGIGSSHAYIAQGASWRWWDHSYGFKSYQELQDFAAQDFGTPIMEYHTGLVLHNQNGNVVFDTGLTQADVGNAKLVSTDFRPGSYIPNRLNFINDSGCVIGYVYDPSTPRQGLWDGNGMVDLALGIATGINNQNQIIGSTSDFNHIIGGGALLEAGDYQNPDFLSDHLPYYMGSQAAAWLDNPFSISNKNQSGSILIAGGSMELNILTSDQYPSDYSGDPWSEPDPVLCTRNNLKKWSFFHVVPPDGTYISEYRNINSLGVIPALGALPDAPIDPITETPNIHALLLLPVDLKVDANRDGRIDCSDRTTAERPYRFWMNNDHDKDGGDVFDGLADSANENIKCIRDLEDYSRLWIDLKQLATIVQANNGISVGLQWKAIPGSTAPVPTIKVFRAFESDGGMQYLTDTGIANSQISGNFDVPVESSDNETVIGSAPFLFPQDFWNDVDENTPKHLIFEGVTEGKGQLELVIFKDGQKIGEGGALYMDIKNIKKMYERVMATPENIPAPYEQMTGPFTGPVHCQHVQDGQAFEKPWDETKECLLFVHGWNCEYNDYVAASETMFKRLWWQGYKGHFSGFRWDTLTSTWDFDPGQFNRSESRAWVYGAALKTWGSALSNQGYTVNLLGHSMGNVVCGEGLRQGLQVRNYFLMQGAVAASCYDPNVVTEDRLVQEELQIPTPDWHINPGDRKVTNGYRGYLQNVSGNLVNYYNPVDWALQTGWSFIGSSNSQVESNWVKNQIDYKPDGTGGAQELHSWLWLYSYSSQVGAFLQRQSTSRHVTDSWEMKAFVARPRTRAVGAQGATGGPIGDRVNLQSVYGFGTERSDHSGQFMRNIQQVFNLYKDIKGKIEQ